jgi:hypothetical protein
MTTATAGAWISDPDGYRRRLRELLGDRDPMKVLSETADTLAGIVAAHTPEQLRSRPFEGKWTPNEVIGHLTDSEWVYGYRMRLILSEDEPRIVGTAQDRWVAAQRFNERDPADLVDMFRSLRKVNLAAWKQVTPDEMQRFGRHNERGDESLAQMFPMLAGHDLAHIDQINRYIAAVKQMAESQRP